MSVRDKRYKIQKALQQSSISMTKKIDDDLDSIRNSIPGFFIKNVRFSIVVMIAIILSGILSISTMQVEQTPPINIPLVIVSVPFIGASPEDVEELVTQKIEDAIANVDDIEEYTSTASQGISSTNITFNESVDKDEKVNDIKAELDKIKNDLPDDGNDFNVFAPNFGDNSPILTYSLTGTESTTQNELNTIAEGLQDEIEGLGSVSKVEIQGGVKSAIEVLVDPDQLEINKLNLDEVSRALQTYNRSLPVGSLLIDEYYFSLTQQGKFTEVQEIENIPLRRSTTQTIKIKDVATVRNGTIKNYNVSRLGRDKKGTVVAVNISIFKKEGISVLDFANVVLKKIDVLASDSQILPTEYELFLSQNNAENTTDSINELVQSGLATIVVLFFVIALFVGFKAAAIAAASVPISFLMTLTVLDILGQSINNVTLFSLILALGLLVDTAIVVVEGCHEKVSEGYDGTTAALMTLKDYQASLISGTLTTVFAFFPMLYLEGTTGQFIRVIPLTVSIVLICSLVVALTFNTLLASKIMKPSTQPHASSDNFIYRMYRSIMKITLSKWYMRIFAFIFSIVLFVGSIALFATKLQFQFFPSTDQDFFQITIEAPQNVDLDYTLRAVKEIETELLAYKHTESFSADVGGSSPGSTQNANFLINVYGDRKDSNGEHIRIDQVIEYFQKQLKTIQGVKVTVKEPSFGPPIATPIALRLIGKNFDTLESESSATVSLMQTVEGVSNPDTNIRYGAGEFSFVIDNERALEKGFTPSQVAGMLRTAISGTTATSVRKDGEELDVIVKLDQDAITSIDDLTSMVLLSPSQEKVQVQDIATVSIGPSLSGITRRDGEKVVQVISFIEGKNKLGQDYTAAEVLENVTTALSDRCEGPTSELNEYCMDSSVRVEFGGEQEESSESSGSLLQVTLIGLLGIIALLVLLFDSFLQPLIVIYTIPLALIAVFPGLLLVGAKLSFPTFVGIAALTGIVVNDAIILVEKINQNLRRNPHAPYIENVIEAGISRWKPILITTLTTALGLVPLLFVDTFYAYLSWTVIFGVISATFFTVTIIPTLYVMVAPRRLLKDKSVSVMPFKILRGLQIFIIVIILLQVASKVL